MHIQQVSRFSASSLIALILLLAGSALAADFPTDPLDSPVWKAMAAKHLGADARIVFDDRVQVLAPAAAENAVATPVEVRAPTLPDVQKIVVFADLNPITKILEYYPVQAEPTIAFRFKIQRATPVRAAMRTADGVWHVGGQWISAQGGGCTTPSMASGSQLWLSRLADVDGAIWPRASSNQRLRLRVIHPMDTGLVANIPAFYITDITLSSADGNVLARLNPSEPVSENPVISVNLNHRGPVVVSGRDNNGNRIHATVGGNQ